MRSTSERKADALARLRSETNVWVASAGAGGAPHLVPLSLCWHEERIVLATRADRPLARDIAASGRARLGLGAGDDVVLIDATAETEAWSVAPERAAFLERTGWDPGRQPGEWVLLRFTPQRVRVWRTTAENRRGSVVMRDGCWLG